MPDLDRTARHRHAPRTRAWAPSALLALLALAACAPAGPPALVADAGADRVVDVGMVVVLDGSGSRPADGLTFTWSFDGLPSGSGAALANADAAVATFVADTPGTFVVRLRVARDGLSAEATVALEAVEAPGVVLEGPPDALALTATTDTYVPAAYPPSAYAITDDGSTALLREVDVRLRLGATVQEVNDLLARYGATIVAMTRGTPVVVLRVPDPGDLAGLDALRARLEAETTVDVALRSVVIEPPADPRAAEAGPAGVAPAAVPWDIALDDPRMRRVDHHLAVRGHAAWNAAPATGRVPTLVLIDFFGDGAPTDGFAGTHTTADYATGAPDSHGYHVLGIATGAHGAGGASTVDRADVTGMAPRVGTVRAVDLRLPTMDTNARMNQRAIQLVLGATVFDPGGRVVVNSSIGLINAFTNPRPEAEQWIFLVRLADGVPVTSEAEALARVTTPGSGLERRFLHATSAGNARSGTSGALARNNISFAYAALGTDMTLNGLPLPALQNVLVVENRVALRHDATSDARPAPACASIVSTMGGNLSAIGSEVWSFGRCTARDAQGNCTAHDVDDTDFKSGTSMAAPQVAGLAMLGWTLAPQLDALELAALLRATALADAPDTAPAICSNIAPQPVIDAYAFVLAAGGLDAWRAVLDADGNGTFDESDVQAWRDALTDRASRFVTYARADLNGDGVVGELERRERVDLDGDGLHGAVVRTIAGRARTFDEGAMSDLDVLCAQAYGPAYQGVAIARDSLLGSLCDALVVRIDTPQAGGAAFGTTVALRARLLDPRDPASEVPDPSGTLTLRWHAELSDGTRVPLAVTRPGESRTVGLPCADAVVRVAAWRDGAIVGRDGVRFEAPDARSLAIPRIATPPGDPLRVNATVAGATATLQAAANQWTCVGSVSARASGFVWRDAATGAVLGTGPTLTLAVDALPPTGRTVRLEHLDGPGYVDERTVIPCRPLALLGLPEVLAGCDGGSLAGRFAQALAGTLTGWDDAARARDDLDDALRTAFLGEPPDPFPTPRPALLSGVVGIVGEGEATPIAWLLNVLDEPPTDPVALRLALAQTEVDAAAWLADDPAVLEVVQAASQAAWTALATFAAPPDGGSLGTGGPGWGAFRYAIGEALDGVTVAPIARVAAYAFLTGFVERYAGAGDFGIGALDLEPGSTAAAVGAALAAEVLVAP